MLHKNQVFMDAVAITNAAVTSDTLQGDLETTDIEIWVAEDFVTADAATLTIALKECATVGGSYTDVLTTKAYAAAALVKSTQPLLRFSMPRGLQTFKEIVATPLATKSFSAGKLNVFAINRQM